MNTSQNVGKNRLLAAVSVVDHLRNELMENDDNYREAEILYQTKSLLMELNQYFGGGYFSADYWAEKIDTIKAVANDISRSRQR
jgi:chemotaxis protein CheY-P-specific phosphatase CheC